MKRTSVADLRARLSHYLRLVQDGETIEVQSHRHPVARIVPAADESPNLVLPADRPVAEMRGLRGVRVGADVDPVAALLRDRTRR